MKETITEEQIVGVFTDPAAIQDLQEAIHAEIDAEIIENLRRNPRIVQGQKNQSIPHYRVK